MRSGESFNFGPLNGSSPTFVLTAAGRYLFEVVAASYGTVTLEKYGPDGVTLLGVSAAVAANGVATLDLAPGTYQVVISGATGVYASVVRISEE